MYRSSANLQYGTKQWIHGSNKIA
ncbi:hypothetical protein RHECNPAF_4300123 [Rhizobium etli CNPAF512]|nr:hypothetical protein RHECNPAF_4300123 [Rhizobium etli CNPAF512]